MKMKLAIGTAFYEVKAYSPYIVSLLDSIKLLHGLGIEWEYMEHSGDSYVDRAKNGLVHRFMESDCTHLFMIDSDLLWNVEGFARLITAAQAGLDLVGGAFPNKNNWQTFGVVPVSDKEGNFYGIERDGFRLIEVMAMPGGFLVFTKKAFESVQPSINRYVDTGARIKKDVRYYEYFRCEVNEQGERMGEDCFFMNKFRSAGGKVFLEPDITFSHFGVKPFIGNYHHYLLKKKKEQDKGGELFQT